MKKYNGKVIDINATAAKVGDKCYDLLAVHALSGCDTVSYPFGKGKTSAVNLMLKLDLNLRMFSDSAAQEHELGWSFSHIYITER
jgi:predicted aminopeptidase